MPPTVPGVLRVLNVFHVFRKERRRTAAHAGDGEDVEDAEDAEDCRRWGTGRLKPPQRTRTNRSWISGVPGGGGARFSMPSVLLDAIEVYIDLKTEGMRR